MEPKRRAGPSKKTDGRKQGPSNRAAGTLSAIPENEVIADISSSSCSASDDSSTTIKAAGKTKSKEDEEPNYEPEKRIVGDYCIVRSFPGVASPKFNPFASATSAPSTPAEAEGKKVKVNKDDDVVVENLNKFMVDQEKKRGSEGSAKKGDGKEDKSNANKASSPKDTRRGHDGRSTNEKIAAPRGNGEMHFPKSSSPRVIPKSGDATKANQERASLRRAGSENLSTNGASPKPNPNKSSFGSFVSSSSGFALTRENSASSLYNTSFESDASGEKWLPLSNGTGAIRISTGPKQTLIPLAVNRQSTDSNGKTNTPTRQDSFGGESITKTASSSGSSVRPNIESKVTSPSSAGQRPKLAKKPSLFSMRKSQSDVGQMGGKNAQGSFRTYFTSPSRINVSASDNYNWGGGYEEPKPEPALPCKLQEVYYDYSTPWNGVWSVTEGVKWTPELGVPWDKKYGVPHPDVAAKGSGWYKDNTLVASKKFVRKVAIKTADKIDEGIDDLSGDIQALLFKQEERPPLKITVIHHFQLEGAQGESKTDGEPKADKEPEVSEEPKTAEVIATDTADVEHLIAQLEAVPVPSSV